MELNDAQKGINPAPRYWEWFQKWWDEDFSWEGLEDKTTKNGIPLQEHYLFGSQTRISRFERNWHYLNLPKHDPAGNVVNRQVEEDRALRSSINFFQHTKVTEIYGILWDNLQFDLQIKKMQWCKTSCARNARRGAKIVSDCFVDYSISSPSEFNDCTIELPSMSVSSTYPAVWQFRRCNFPTEVKLSCGENIRLHILECTGDRSITISAKNIEISNLIVELISIYAVDGRDVVINPKIDIALEDNHATTLSLRTTSNKTIKSAMVNLTLGNSIYLQVTDYHFKSFDIQGQDLNSLTISDCIFTDTLTLDHRHFSLLEVLRSTFQNGLSISGSEFSATASFSGCKIYDLADFTHCTFRQGLVVTNSAGVNKELEGSVLVNSHFDNAVFFDRVERDLDSCAYFNDTEFLGSTSFEETLFNGVPKFHGCKLHQETSFRTLQKIPAIDGKPIENSKIYGHYQAAFRTLRQHMENNNSFSEAFMFGRMEMIAKQRRSGSRDVPYWDRLFTRIYGIIADYGQSAIRPLTILIPVFLLSCMFQLTIQFMAGGCYFLSKTCEFDYIRIGEAFERASLFSLPPFTLLTNGAVGEQSSPNMRSMLQAISGVGLVIHALVSSILVFTVLLALKRRLQIR